jgi:enoyl reductase-like protein
MGKSVRLSDAETEAIRNKAIDINKLLIAKGVPPLKDSELVHKILDLSVAYVQMKPDGTLFLDLG